MVIVCNLCEGSGKIPSIGMVRKTCIDCKGSGHVPVKGIIDTRDRRGDDSDWSSYVPKKRGRKPNSVREIS